MSESKEDEAYTLAPKFVMGAQAYADLRDYMLKLARHKRRNEAVALVLEEDGALRFVHVQVKP